MANTRLKADDSEQFDGDEEGENGESQDNGSVLTGVESKTPAGRRKALHQVVDLQQDAYVIARGLAGSQTSTEDKELQAKLASAFSSVCSVWTKLQDAKREIRGKGKVMPIPAKVTNTRKPVTYQIDENAIAPTAMNDSPASS